MFAPCNVDCEGEELHAGGSQEDHLVLYGTPCMSGMAVMLSAPSQTLAAR